MTIHYSDDLADARLEEVVAAIDAGSGPGVLVVGTSALSGAVGVLFTVTLDDPSGTVAGRVLTFSGTPINTTATGVGVAAKAELRDSDDNVICDGLTVGVTGSGSNIIMDTASVTVGRPVQLVSATITHP